MTCGWSHLHAVIYVECCGPWTVFSKPSPQYIIPSLLILRYFSDTGILCIPISETAIEIELLWKANRYDQDEPAYQVSRSKFILFRTYCPDTQQTDCFIRTTKLSVKHFGMVQLHHRYVGTEFLYTRTFDSDFLWTFLLTVNCLLMLNTIFDTDYFVDSCCGVRCHSGMYWDCYFVDVSDELLSFLWH